MYSSYLVFVLFLTPVRQHGTQMTSTSELILLMGLRMHFSL